MDKNIIGELIIIKPANKWSLMHHLYYKFISRLATKDT